MPHPKSEDLTNRLFGSDAASALTNRAAQHIIKQEAAVQERAGPVPGSDEMVELLFNSNEASALTDEAARHIEQLAYVLKQAVEPEKPATRMRP